MSGTTGALVLIIVVLILLYIRSLMLRFAEDPEVNSGPSSKPKRRGKVSSSFEKVNKVEGVLTVDGKEIKTYRIGTLMIGNVVEMDFYDSMGKNIMITDILYNGNSLFGYTEGSYRDRCDYAVSVLKQIAHKGGCPRHLAVEVEQIILDVDDLNAYIAEGHIRQTGEEYAWVA